MKFTFGIITSPSTQAFLQDVINSIAEENIPEFEVIVIGGDQYYDDGGMRILPFDETEKPMWITRKKNMITEEAKYENIVYLHDYVALTKGWYEGFLRFGNDFDICMTKIINGNGSRFRDWTLLPDDLEHVLGKWDGKYLLPYNIKHFTRHMYISGAYWVGKKSIMEKYPFDEELSWGQGEDVKWSKQVREKHTFSMNEHSAVHLLKLKDPVFSDITQDMLEKLERHNETLQVGSI
jgi:hypothetical protein